MAEAQRKLRLVQIIALLAVLALFAADYGFGVMAKDPPAWAYFVPGLLALGLEAEAVRRLLVQMIKSMARIPPNSPDSE
ncbi:MAG: hypothetical protein GYB53_25355 [Rhodobacteraceae bacterium]|nr:hypothetical protein [Paracoccaceae bacterium]MBR9823009.1 hypothetical protein [Paracoccaceae bacterium]